MAKITRRGEYQWQARIRRVGYPEQSKTFTTKAEAESWVRDIEGRIDRGIFIDTNLLEKTKLSELLDRYGREITIHKKGATQERSKIKTLMESKLGSMRIGRIQASDIVDFREERSKKVGPATVIKEINLLSNVFNIARSEWGIRGLENPVQGVRRPKSPKGRRRRLHSDDEMQRIIDATESPTLKVLIPLAVETAMRRGEMMSVEWKDINFAKQTIELMDSKTGPSRTVPLSKRALDLLRSIPRGPNEKLFQVKPNAVTLAFIRARKRARGIYEAECKENGIEVDDEFLMNLRLHDMRREATSRLLEDKKLEIIEVMSVTGHKDARMLDLYTKLRAERIAKKLG
jgi:integrase